MSFAASLFATVYGSMPSIGSDGWISSYFTGADVGTHAGVPVNEQSAMQVTAVYGSIALISEAVAMLPIDVLQRVGGRREKRDDHPIARLLRNPNRLMTQADLQCTTQSHALQYGNGYQDIQRNEGGQPIALWPLLPDRTRPVARNEAGGERVIVYQTVVDGKMIEIQPGDIIHIRGMAFDGLRGYSPIQKARQAVGLALGLEEFGAKFFGNDAKSGGFIEHPGKLGPEAQKNLQDSMGAQGGISNAHRVKILEEGMKFNPSTISPEDSQFLATRGYQVEEIARIFRVPLHMLQSQTKTTSWGSGISQLSLAFVTFTLGIWLIRSGQELGRKLLTPADLAAGYYLKYNVKALLRADAATRAKFYTAALNRAAGWMSRNEVRALEDLNPDDVANETAPVGAPLPFMGPDDETAEPDDDEDDDE